MAFTLSAMGRVILPVRFVALHLLLACGIAAQSNEWPALFSVPERVEVENDSVFLLSTDAKLFQYQENTRNLFRWAPRDSLLEIRQQGLYETSSYLNTDVLNQFFDFSGSVRRRDLLPGGGMLGLEWTPTSYLNLRQTGGQIHATGDIGPLARWDYRDLPIMIRGGLSTSGWDDSLHPVITRSRLKDAHGDVGFYGAGVIGDAGSRLFDLPLYLQAEVFGRSISEAGRAVVTGRVLFADELNSGDSLFAYYGDSLSNGKENIWGSEAGQLRYSSTPWRIARSLEAAAGFKARERLGLRPGIIYRFSENSVAYPRLQGVLSDVRQRSQTIHLLLGSNDSLRIYSRGGIRFSWGPEDWLFGRDLTATALSFTRDSLQLDSLQTKLLDHKRFNAVADNVIGFNLSPRVLIEYAIAARRDSKTYTFFYRNGPDTVRNFDDNDRILLTNRLSITARDFGGLRAGLFGELSDHIINFLRKERSAQNVAERGYRLGLTLSYRIADRLLLEEYLVADAQVSDYLYKEAHRSPFDPPDYQRSLTSSFSGQWLFTENWRLVGSWSESYFDNGSWYGKEYFDTTGAVDNRVDYYAIDEKKTDYTIAAGIARETQRLRLEGGCRLQDVFNVLFRGGSYQNVEWDKGYAIEPYLTMRMNFRLFSLQGRLARIFYTLEEKTWKAEKNWDVHLVGQAAW